MEIELEQLRVKNQPFLIYFSEKDCGPCQMMATELQELEKNGQDNIPIVRVDINTCPALTLDYSTQYQMKGIPTLMLFRGQSLLWKHSGYLKATVILEQIERHYRNYLE